MTIDNVMPKYKMSIDDVLNVRTISSGTVTIATLFYMDAEITALEQRRDKTIAITQGMMQQFLAGKVRLLKSER